MAKPSPKFGNGKRNASIASPTKMSPNKTGSGGYVNMAKFQNAGLKGKV